MTGVIKVSQLPDAGELTGAEMLLGVQGGESVKIEGTRLATIPSMVSAVTQAETAAQEAKAAADAAQLSGGVYPDTAAGLAATQEGRYFSVPSSTDGEYLILYRKVNGAAVEVRRYPSAHAVQAVEDELQQRILANDMEPATLIPAFAVGGRVPAWFVDGAFDVAGVTQHMRDLATADVAPRGEYSGGPVPLMSVGGGVLGWMDASGRVYWHGQPEGMDVLAAKATFEPRQSVVTANAPTKTDGRSLHRCRLRMARQQSGLAEPLKLLITGDSWIGQTYVADGLLSRAAARGYPQTAKGYVSPGGSQIRGVGMAASGWTQTYAQTGATMIYGSSINGYSLDTTAVDATITVTGLTATDIEIHYSHHGGTFRYRVDGGDWTIVACDASGEPGFAMISGLADGPHTVEIDTTGNTGRVVFLGMYAHSPAKAGLELIKAGASGINTPRYGAYIATAIPQIERVNPDVVVVLLGTNDYSSVNTTLETYVAGLNAIASAYRAASDAGLVFCVPADSNRVPNIPLSVYRDTLHRWCIENGCEFLDLYELMGPFAEANALGFWHADGYHPTAIGGTAIAEAVCKYLEL